MPNVHNHIIPEAVRAHQTASSHYSINLPAGYLQQRNRQFIANDSTTNKALFGYQQGLGKWGFFVADDGVDVTTNTDLSKFIFNSGQDTFKIISSPTVNLTLTGNASSGSSASISVAHGLTFTPAYIAYITTDPVLAGYFASGNYKNGPNPFLIIGTSSAASIPIFAAHQVTVDATNINFSAYTSVQGVATYNMSAKVYLLQETFS